MSSRKIPEAVTMLIKQKQYQLKANEKLVKDYTRWLKVHQKNAILIQKQLNELKEYINV